MTADIINLRKARKTKARQDAEKRAAENRVVYGRTKAEKLQASAAAEIERVRLDGAKRESARHEPTPAASQSSTLSQSDDAS